MRTHALLPLLAPALLVACAHAGRADAVARGRVSERPGDEQGTIVQEVDIDGDGRVDVRKVLRDHESSRTIVKKEVDLDFDGRWDVVSTFDDDGQLAVEQMDSDFDGRLDWTDHYKSGVRVMAEMDSSYDGRPDLWFYYAVGDDGVPRIDRKERDTDGDTRVDLWERFDAAGNVVRTGRDLDGDGRMDVRDE